MQKLFLRCIYYRIKLPERQADGKLTALEIYKELKTSLEAVLGVDLDNQS